MPVRLDLAGRTFAPTAPYAVSAAKIAEFADSIGADRDGPVPPTFPIVVAFSAMNDLMVDPDVGIELRNVVHADQRFEIARPVRAGDVLTARLTVDSVRSAAGADLISTRSEVSTVDGEPVCTAYATLVHREGPRSEGRAPQDARADQHREGPRSEGRAPQDARADQHREGPRSEGRVPQDARADQHRS